MNSAIESTLEPEEQVCWRNPGAGQWRDFPLTGGGRSSLSSFRQHTYYLQELKDI